MTTIPMTIEGLKEQYEFCKRAEDLMKYRLCEIRRATAVASRDRKKAYLRWQNKLKEESRC